ncbi:MAG: endonuclease domain-containing protein [Pseudomonadota bacterium]
MRKEMTLPEIKLWQALRGKKLGVKFRRQYPIGPYVADFFCNEKKLVIEVDGQVHGMGEKPESDAARDNYMKEQGYTVLRFAAETILSDFEAVIIAIAAQVDGPLHQPSPRLRPVPLPASGEDI